MMEAANTSETSVNFYQTIRSNNPEDSHLHVMQLQMEKKKQRQNYRNGNTVKVMSVATMKA
jgi:hypothetical protein